MSFGYFDIERKVGLCLLARSYLGVMGFICGLFLRICLITLSVSR